MSRSFRHVPVCARFGRCRRSDKMDKRQYNRRGRHLAVQILNVIAVSEDFDCLAPLPLVREVSDARGFYKDGKKRFANLLVTDPDRFAKQMRK